MENRTDDPPLTESLVRVRRELNHLYTEPMTTSDAGLFCREHALHLHGIAAAMGRRSTICTGCFGLRIPGRFSNSMTDTDGDHAWCRIDGIVPVDLSLTLRGWPVQRADVTLVYGRDPQFLAGFELKYLLQCPGPEIEGILAASPVDVLVYSEHALEQRSALELHKEPFTFLLPPQRGGPTLLKLLGDHIFFAITLYCLKLARGQARPLSAYREQWSALRTVAAWYPRAREEMEAEWSSAGSVS